MNPEDEELSHPACLKFHCRTPLIWEQAAPTDENCTYSGDSAFHALHKVVKYTEAFSAACSD